MRVEGRRFAVVLGWCYIKFWRLDLFSSRGDARTLKTHEVLASFLVLMYLKFWSISVKFIAL